MRVATAAGDGDDPDREVMLRRIRELESENQLLFNTIRRVLVALDRMPD